MKKLLPHFNLKLILVVLIAPFYGVSFAQTQEVKITLTGYSDDVVADAVLNTLPTAVSTNSIDLPTGTHDLFFAQGYSNNAVAYSNGLPDNGQFTSSAGHNFQMAPYNANNALRLEALQSGTLTFDVTQQTSYDSLYVLATGGSGAPTVDYTINFSDASTTPGVINVDDWGSCSGGCTTYAINNLNRIDRTTGTLQGSNIFSIFEYPIILSAGDQAKQIVSIDFTVPSGETGAANIFGITGYMPISLPVTLEYFNVSAVNGQALLQWKTAQEFNNNKFIIERATSANPSSFVKVGVVNATASASGSVYTFTNNSGVSGTFLYRLLQEDIDGNIKILGTKSITFNTKIKWLIQDMGTQWELISPSAFIYRLLDMNGRVLQAASGTGSATITKPLAHGIYEIQVQAGGEFSTQKLIK